MNTTHISVADVLSYEQLPEDIKTIAEKYFAEKIVELEEKISKLEDAVEEAREEGYDAGYDAGKEIRDDEVEDLESHIETLELRISELEEELAEDD